MRNLSRLLIVVILGGSLVRAEATAQTGNIGAEPVLSITALYDLAEELRRNERSLTDLEESVKIYSELVERGHAPSMHRLALAHFYGRGVPIDQARSAQLLRAAVAGGNSGSRVWLGRVLLVVGGSEQEAFDILSEAVAEGLDGAEYRFALGHVQVGFGTSSDPTVGLEILSRLSVNGNISATYELAMAYRSDISTPMNLAKARILFDELVAEGHAQSAERLAEMYRDGEGGPQNFDRAEALLNIALESGRLGAGIKLADMLIAIGRPGEARTILAESAARGSLDAQIKLALGDVSGSFASASEVNEGRAALALLSEKSDPLIANRLARHALQVGLPTGVDMEDIARDLEEAAKSGDGRSAERLVRLLRDRPEWFEDAIGRRKLALEEHGLLMQRNTYFNESIRLIGETNSGANAGRLMVETLREVDGEAFQAGLLAAFATNRNGYVYLIQSELQNLGYYGGRLTGIADRATLRAVMTYCQANGIITLCAAGPLRSDVARALAVSLTDPAADPT